MFKWIKIIGYVLVIYSALVLLTDFLPVDFWVSLSELFTGDKHKYYKVVPAEGGKTYSLVALILGIVLISIGHFSSVKYNT